MRFFCFILLICIFNVITLSAQPPCAGPGATAQTAQAVCATQSFQQQFIPPCTGVVLPPITGNICPAGDNLIPTSNSAWYKINIFQTGTLGFTITPAMPGADYDWVLFNVTNQAPQNVYITNLVVGYNQSATTGPTGCSAAGTVDYNCLGATPRFNRLLPVIAGEEFLLMVKKFSGTGTEYNILFGGGTALLTNSLPPSVTSAAIVGCNPSQIRVNFSEEIRCNSVTTTGQTEFIISNGPHTITGIAYSCNTGSNSFNTLTLSLQNPLPPGNYTLTVNSGGDGNTLLDVCGDPMAAGVPVAFTIPPQTPPTITQVTKANCAGTILKVALSQPVLCTSISPNGSEFNITPGSPTINSVTTNCSGSILSTDTIFINLQNPLADGNYTLTAGISPSDGNTFIDNCGILMAVGTNRAFTIATTPAPTVTNPPAYCQSFTAVVLQATGTNLLWYASATGGTGSTTAPVPSTTTAGTFNFYVSQTIANCEGPRALITVTVNPSPVAPTVNPATFNYCTGQTATVLSATGFNILWYTTATGGTGSSTAPTPSTATAGITSYYATQTINSCESPTRAVITVNVTAVPVAPSVTSPLVLCQGSPSVQLTATGTNLLWYNTASGGIGSTTAPTASAASLGTTNYYVSQTNIGSSSCEGPRAQITVNVVTIPAAPTVTNPPAYCLGATALALQATGTNLLWYTSPTGGTGSTTAPVPLTTTAGTFNFYVSQTTGGCEGTRAVITVTVNPLPPAPTVNPATFNYCAGQTATTLSATGANILWYTTATGGTGSSTAPTPSTATAGITFYYATQTLNGCESATRAVITINVTAVPVAPSVTSPLVLCQGSPSVQLTATGTNLLWYNTASGGIGSTTAPTASAASLGTTNYYVSQTNIGSSNCEGPRAQITVNVVTTPAAPTVVSPLNYCQNQIVPALTAGGSNLLWYANSTGGTGNSTAPVPTTSTIGSITYYVSQSVGTCESPRSSIEVNIATTPAAPAVTPQVNYCEGSSAVALTAPGTNIKWYTTVTGGTSLPGAPTPSTATAGTTSYFVSQSIGTCESPRAEIMVVVTAIPAAPMVGPTVNYCQGETPMNFIVSGTNLLWYANATGGTGNPVAPTVSTVSVSTNTYYVSQSTAGCEGPRASITVNVNTTLSAPTVPPTQTYCQNAPTNPLVVSGSNLKWYTQATGGSSSTTTPVVSSATAGTITYYVSQTTGNCESPRASISINITATPAAPTASSIINYCPNEVVGILADSVTGTNLLWYANATGGAGSVTSPIINTTVFPAIYTFYVSQTSSASSGSCEGPRAQITVNVDNFLNVNIGNDTTICEGSSVKFFPIVTPNGALYQWRSLDEPNSTIDSITLLNATVKPLNDTRYVLLARIGGCIKEDTVQVTVRTKPVVSITSFPTAICISDSALLTGVVSRITLPGIISVYKWTPVSGIRFDTALQTYAYPVTSTLYTLTATTTLADYGCDFTSTGTINVIVQPIVKAFAGRDTIAVKGAPHQLQGSGATSYEWSSPTGIILNPFVKNPFATLNNDAVFYLKGTDQIGCIGLDTVFIKVLNGPAYYVPNAFTPNGDGQNDIFRAIPVGFANTTHFRVFNRYGLLLFETNQYLKGWDGTYNGKLQPNGVYVWTVAGIDKDFKRVELKGTVNLIR